MGMAADGIAVDHVQRFHGNLTSTTYISRTDRILLQFCYRSETFSARNIQLHYIAIGMYHMSHIPTIITFNCRRF